MRLVEYLNDLAFRAKVSLSFQEIERSYLEPGSLTIKCIGYTAEDAPDMATTTKRHRWLYKEFSGRIRRQAHSEGVCGCQNA